MDEVQVSHWDTTDGDIVSLSRAFVYMYQGYQS